MFEELHGRRVVARLDGDHLHARMDSGSYRFSFGLADVMDPEVARILGSWKIAVANEDRRDPVLEEYDVDFEKNFRSTSREPNPGQEITGIIAPGRDNKIRLFPWCYYDDYQEREAELGIRDPLLQVFAIWGATTVFMASEAKEGRNLVFEGKTSDFARTVPLTLTALRPIHDGFLSLRYQFRQNDGNGWVEVDDPRQRVAKPTVREEAVA